MDEKNYQNNVQNPESTDKDIDVRTMESDLNSIVGGGNPQSPYNPLNKESSPSPSQSSGNLMDNLSKTPDGAANTSFVGGGEKSMPPELSGESGAKKKNILIGIIAFVLILGLGALGYFVVYPLIFKSGVSEENVSSFEGGGDLVLPPQNLGSETTTGTTTGETSTVNEGKESTSGVVQTGSVANENLPKEKEAEHISLFSKVDELVTTTEFLTGKTLKALKLPSNIQKPAFVEVVFTDPKLTISALLGNVLSLTANEILDKSFDPLYTSGFVYVDKNGELRMGFAAKLNSSSSLIDERASIAKTLESNTNLKNFYDSDPGSIQGWKNGSPITNPHRYTLFSKSGYSLDYGWKNDIFIIASSYDGFKAAVDRLK